MTLLCVVSAMAMPVEDITLINVAPKEGELDLSLRSLDQITLTFSQAVEADASKTATLLLPNGETLTSKLTVNRYMKNTVTLNFPDVQPLNGKYVLTIKRWSVGDAEWVENYETGHSNPKIEVEWTVSSGGLEAGVNYDLNPISITPANNASIPYSENASIRIVMPQGIIINPNEGIYLSCIEAKYLQQLTFVAQAGNNITYTAEISPAPVVHGDYTLMIPGGAFGDADFIAGNGGHANPPITYMYAVAGNTSEDGELLGGVDYSEKPTSIEILKEGDRYIATLQLDGSMVVNEAKVSDCKLLDTQAYEVSDATFALNTFTDGKLTISFTAQLEEDELYTFLIPQGLYGSQSWQTSDYTSGTSNPQLRQDFTPANLTVSVDTIESDRANQSNTVYSATGIMLYKDATEAQINALAPGFYIIAGKKVMVK